VEVEEEPHARVLRRREGGDRVAHRARLRLREVVPVAVRVDVAERRAPVALVDAVGIDERDAQHAESRAEVAREVRLRGERLDEAHEPDRSRDLGRMLPSDHDDAIARNAQRDAREAAARVLPPRAIARVEAVIVYTTTVALVLFFFIVLIGLAGWIPLYLCWWGRLTPQPPCCAACGHASGDGPGMLADRCAECGCDLNAPNALVYFKRARTPLMLAGIIVGAIVVTLCSLLPLASISVLFLAASRQGVLLPTPANNAVPSASDSTSGSAESAPRVNDDAEPSDSAEAEGTTSQSSKEEDIR
jgi:hypothetical protein